MFLILKQKKLISDKHDHQYTFDNKKEVVGKFISPPII